jgi:long-chain acyl-CoA synthetase
VGKALAGVEVKIAQDGEILVRGGNVMQGYFKRPVATAEAFEDGWFKTGDAGSLDGEGRLTITDRLKDLMKTSSGKYIAPQQIEVLLEGDPFLEQVCVVGDGRRFISALVVPVFPVLEAFAKARGIPSSARADLCKKPEILALFRERIDARTKDLARHEQVKKFVLLLEPFTVEGGDLTPTLKVRRRGISEKYARLIESLYAET